MYWINGRFDIFDGKIISQTVMCSDKNDNWTVGLWFRSFLHEADMRVALEVAVGVFRLTKCCWPSRPATEMAGPHEICLSHTKECMCSLSPT